MSPVLLLLLLAALNSESNAASSENSTGLKFVVAFPENIAHYHPDEPVNKIHITALHPDTLVEIKTYSDQLKTSNTLATGQTWDYTVEAKMEIMGWVNTSEKSLQIIGNKLITVHVVYLKKDSLQTTLLTPADRMGKEYLIPPVPTIEGTTYPVDQVTKSVTERGPFKLVIINTDQQNTVTVKGAVNKKVSLKPHQIAQVSITADDALRVVEAENPVAVHFGHTCAIRQNCTCGQLFTMLSPTKQDTLKYYIPPILAKDAESKTKVLVSEKGSTQIVSFDPNSPLVETTGTAVLYRPGLLLTLIPESNFASCSVINSIPDAVNFAVILVHKDATDGVHIGSRSLASEEWLQLKGTEYVSTSTVLASGKNVIWHASSNIAVYFIGSKGGSLFGNPAPVISKTPDYRGCVLSPEVLKIGEVAGGWRESLKYCQDNDLELISFPTADFQKQVYEKVSQMKNDSLKNVWFGMRRSSQTGAWYWLNNEPVSDTNWAENEPGTLQEGQCAIMSLESKDFDWTDEDCCKKAHPICYSSPVLLPI